MDEINVKICGLKHENDVRLCMDLGVNILGFVTEYPIQVPWNLTRKETLPLLKMVKPPFRSCIVTGGPCEKIIDLATYLRPDIVQLHYKETLEDTKIICDSLQKLNIDVIKTVPPKIEDRISQFNTYDIEIIAEKLCKCGVYGLLADSRTPSNASLKGCETDLDFCKQILKFSSKPVIIAGGINAENVINILKNTGAKFIDVMTGVESIPGEKDIKKLSALLTESRGRQTV